MIFLGCLLGFLLAFTPSVYSKSKAKDAVLLSKVKSLTLTDGKLTSSRRVSPIPQLNCVGGNAKGLYAVDVMRCENAGSDYDAEDIQWTCKASIPPEFKLGGTEVVCEGYDSPDDPYVLKGSCGVEYRLVLTNSGEEKYWDTINRSHGDSGENKVVVALFWVVFIAVLAWIIYKVFINPDNPRRGPGDGFRLGWNGGGGGGGGGGGDDGHDDPPPPYAPQAPKPTSSYRANRAAPGYSAGSSHGQNPDGTWRPGFWTGAATGAAAAYAANAYRGRDTRRDRRYDDPQVGSSSWFGRTRDASPPRRTGWFGNPSPARPPNSTPFGGGSSYFGTTGSTRSRTPPAPSSSRYESTGFGGTRRR